MRISRLIDQWGEITATSADETKQAVVSTITQPHLNDPTLYLNRELAWLSSNQRVLREAEDSRNPLLERFKFLAIVSSDLDEFFMERISGLKQQLGAVVAKLSVDGRTPKQQIDECCEQVSAQEARQHDALQQMLTELRRHDVKLLSYEELSEKNVKPLLSRSVTPK